MRYSLRAAALALSLLALSGCNSLTSDSVNSFRLLLDNDRNKIPAERVNNSRADTLLISAAGAQGLFIAPAGSSGIIRWRGVTEQLETHNGRMTQLVGMKVDVLAPLNAEDPLARNLLQISDGTEIVRTVDYPLTYQTGLQQVATYYRGPLEVIGQQTYQRIDEHIRMPQIDYKATNYYWVDPATGSVRRSIQNLAPELPAFDLLFTHQPPRGDQP
ncbi:MAG: YjbF family lipoprotein [Pseudomonadaceae bacterium]